MTRRRGACAPQKAAGAAKKSEGIAIFFFDAAFFSVQFSNKTDLDEYGLPDCSRG